MNDRHPDGYLANFWKVAYRPYVAQSRSSQKTSDFPFCRMEIEVLLLVLPIVTLRYDLPEKCRRPCVGQAESPEPELHTMVTLESVACAGEWLQWFV